MISAQFAPAPQAPILLASVRPDGAAITLDDAERLDACGQEEGPDEEVRETAGGDEQRGAGGVLGRSGEDGERVSSCQSCQ